MKKFYRSKSNKVIAGVCGGLAQYTGLDAMLVRIIFILLLLGTGLFPFGIAYLLIWWLVPEESPYTIVSEQ